MALQKQPGYGLVGGYRLATDHVKDSVNKGLSTVKVGSLYRLKYVGERFGTIWGANLSLAEFFENIALFLWPSEPGGDTGDGHAVDGPPIPELDGRCGLLVV